MAKEFVALTCEVNPQLKLRQERLSSFRKSGENGHNSFLFFERFALADRVLVWIVAMKPEPSELATRWTLIRKLNKTDCDEESWKDFYNLYRKLIYGVARKSG